MKQSLSAFLLLAVLPTFSFASDKGTCPPPPSAAIFSEAKNVAAHIQKKTNASAGTMVFLFVISDTGYLCSAEVLQGVDKKADSEALQSVRQWHFDPAKKDGRSVPAVNIVPVKYQLDKEGHILLVKPSQSRREGVVADTKPAIRNP